MQRKDHPQVLYDFSCNFDTNYKDSTSKIGCLQGFFNSLRNKSSRVETPTAGYGLVIYSKDLTTYSRLLAEDFLY